LKANGVENRTILLKHILPNSINPLLAIAGIDLAYLLNGSLITEYIFGLPGMGRLTLMSILERDYPMIIGCCLLAGVIMIVANIISDIFRSLLDKRNAKILVS
jgi:peptide/nickel transport system permease protein